MMLSNGHQPKLLKKAQVCEVGIRNRNAPGKILASSFSPNCAILSNTASVQVVLREKVERVKWPPGKTLWLRAVALTRPT